MTDAMTAERSSCPEEVGNEFNGISGRAAQMDVRNLFGQAFYAVLAFVWETAQTAVYFVSKNGIFLGLA